MISQPIQLLANFRSHLALGGQQGLRALSPEERAMLREELRKLQESNGRLVWIAISLLCLLFLVTMTLSVLAGLSADAAVRAASLGAVGALGLSTAGCVRWLLRLWQSKAATEQLTAIAVTLEGEALSKLIDALVEGARIEISKS